MTAFQADFETLATSLTAYFGAVQELVAYTQTLAGDDAKVQALSAALATSQAAVSAVLPTPATPAPTTETPAPESAPVAETPATDTPAA